MVGVVVSVFEGGLIGVTGGGVVVVETGVFVQLARVSVERTMSPKIRGVFINSMNKKIERRVRKIEKYYGPIGEKSRDKNYSTI